VLDSKTGKVSISTQQGQIALSAPAGQVSVDAATVDVHAKGTLNLSGDAGVVIKGATVRIN
jgi:hypothetical protein